MPAMPQMQSLMVLLQCEQQQRDLAQSALRQAENAARRAADQHAQLLAYRAEYEGRWSAQFNLGGTVEILACYRSFMQRLDQALALQERQATLSAAQIGPARRVLLECERRVASVRKLLDRRLAERAHVGRQREQKQTDELAQRMHWHTAPPHLPN
jgi:flagellar FliJ protein